MSSRRSYGSYNDGCAAAHALDLIGERWTLIVLRELFLGPKRFAELQRDVIGISPTVLSRRLRDLASRGIVIRSTLPPPARVDVYELTPWGQRLEAVNTALSAWAVASPALPWDADMSPDTLVLSMRAHARKDATPAGPLRVNLFLTDSRIDASEPVAYSAVVAQREILIEKAPTPGAADAEVHAGTAAWKACIIGGEEFDTIPGVRVSGNPLAVAALVTATKLDTDSEGERPTADAATGR